MDGSRFISAGKFGTPMSSDDFGRAFSLLRGEDPGYIDSLERVSFSERIKSLRNAWPHVGSEGASALVDSYVKVDGLYLQFPEYISIPKGATIFRARAVSDFDQLDDPLSTRRLAISQLWEPPAACVKCYGRLNKPGESYLYSNFGNIESTLNEARIKPNSLFALICYETLTPIKAIGIGVYLPEEALFISIKSDKAFNEYLSLHRFLMEEFSRPAEDGMSNVYAISNAIVDELYSYEHCVAYKPVGGGAGLNLRMEPRFAHDSLAVKAVLFGIRMQRWTDSNIVCYGRWHVSKQLGRYIAREDASRPMPLSAIFSKGELVCPSSIYRLPLYEISAYRPCLAGLNNLV